MGSISSPEVRHVAFEQIDDLFPVLHDMANEAEVLEQVRERRFDSDRPPPYYESPPEPDPDDQNAPVLWGNERRDPTVAELQELLDEPLDEIEMYTAQYRAESFQTSYDPGRRYEEEAKLQTCRSRDEDRRQGPYSKSGRVNDLHRKVVVRHRIRKRWERLGVWNPDWGIPGRVDASPRDSTFLWKWKWQGDTPTRGQHGYVTEPPLPDHPNTRAFQLRRGLRRGERGPVMPRSRLGADASKSEAEAFITSRPWYTYGVDIEEEKTRLERVSKKGRCVDMDHEKYVYNRWKDAGESELSDSWKWGHESPELRPEEHRDDIEFSPSEIDALEAIPPPSPPREPPHIPMPKNLPPPREGLFNQPVTPSIFGSRPPAPQQQDQPDAGDLDSLPPAPPARRGRPPGRRLQLAPVRHDGSGIQASEHPPPRRSTRVAQKMQATVQPAAKPAPPKTTRAKKAQALPSTLDKAAPRRGRGRPPKSLTAKAAKRQGVVKGRGRPPKSNAAENKKRVERIQKTEAVAPKRGPGRPPKTETTAPKRGRPSKAAAAKSPMVKAAKPQGVVKRTGRPPKSNKMEPKKRAGRPSKVEPTGPKRGPGRPPKAERAAQSPIAEAAKSQTVVKKAGRPPRAETSAPTRGRGRPAKTETTVKSPMAKAAKPQGVVKKTAEPKRRAGRPSKK